MDTKIILNARLADGARRRHVFKTLQGAQAKARELVGDQPEILDGRAAGNGQSLTCKGARFEQLFDRVQAPLPDVDALKVRHAAEDDMDLLVAVPSNSRSGLMYDVARDRVTQEVRCECLGFAYSPAEPKFCGHIRELLGKQVFTAAEEALFEASIRAEEARRQSPPRLVRPASSDKVSELFRALRKARFAAARGMGKASEDPNAVLGVSVASAFAMPDRYDGVVIETAADARRHDGLVLRAQSTRVGVHLDFADKVRALAEQAGFQVEVEDAGHSIVVRCKEVA